MLTIIEHIESYLKNPFAPLWWPGLAQHLVRQLEMHAEEDSSSQWIACVPPERAWHIANQGNVDFNFFVELLATQPALQLSSRGMIFTDKVTVEIKSLNGLTQALKILQYVPSLATAIDNLTKSIHILEAPEPEIDISFSDPLIPFSVFLNVSEGQFADFRTAEALVHEAMHLQLSLIERFYPIATPNQGLHYSPWKQSRRPVTGLMHGLYVFRVIEQWLTNISRVSEEAKEYSQKRKTQIRLEIDQLSPESLVDYLTEGGKKLLSCILGAAAHSCDHG